MKLKRPSLLFSASPRYFQRLRHTGSFVWIFFFSRLIKIHTYIRVYSRATSSSIRHLVPNFGKRLGDSAQVSLFFLFFSSLAMLICLTLSVSPPSSFLCLLIAISTVRSISVSPPSSYIRLLITHSTGLALSPLPPPVSSFPCLLIVVSTGLSLPFSPPSSFYAF